MTKHFTCKLAMLIRAVPATVVGRFTDGHGALTPRQKARLEEMEKDYAEFMRIKDLKTQTVPRQNIR